MWSLPLFIARATGCIFSCALSYLLWAISRAFRKKRTETKSSIANSFGTRLTKMRIIYKIVCNFFSSGTSLSILLIDLKARRSYNCCITGLYSRRLLQLYHWKTIGLTQLVFSHVITNRTSHDKACVSGTYHTRDSSAVVVDILEELTLFPRALKCCSSYASLFYKEQHRFKKRILRQISWTAILNISHLVIAIAVSFAVYVLWCAYIYIYIYNIYI